MRRTFLLLLFLPILISAQDKADDIRWTTRLDFMVPQPVANKAFKLSFTGIFDLGFSVNRRIGKMLNLGVAYRFKQFQVRGNKIPDVDMLQHTHNALLRFSFDKPVGKNALLTPALNTGYNWLDYSKIPCVNGNPFDKNVEAINLEPNVSYVWMIDEGFGMGLMVNYNLLTYEFNPDGVCLNEHKSYSEKEKTGLTSSFSFGFSVFIDFAHRAEGFEE
ncbi:MAG: hypothetical protein IT233_05135 [Bacteroidia bacterium]|nr:hypothetical protein [Bacteroidia bacterium]